MFTSARQISILLIPLLIVSACEETDHGHDHNDEHSHDHDDHEYHRLTVWDNASEWMVRFELHENSGRIEGRLYLTENGSPVRHASGTLRFEQDGTVENETELEPVSEGIYAFELFFGQSDRPELIAEFPTEGEPAVARFGPVDRYEGHPHLPAEQVVELEKERQWLLGVVSAETSARPVPVVVPAIGRAIPDPRSVTEIISPVDGHIDPEDLVILPAAGQRVERGERITAISPPLSGDRTWARERIAYIQAKEAYERARRLLDSEAISFREYQLREREYETRRDGYEHAIDHDGHGAGHVIDDDGDLYLTAARDGTVSRVSVVPGRQINGGETLLTLYDPEALWLELSGYVDQLEGLSELQGVEIETGRGRTATLDSDRVSLVSRDEQSDPTGTRSSLTVSVDNRDRALRAHQPLRASLLTGSDTSRVAVPESALFDENSHRVVFVQHSGDQFERRVVETGGRYGGFVTIVEGLSEGERVVTGGVYGLHLATGDVEIGDGHSH